jgi:hypothetical protein
MDKVLYENLFRAFYNEKIKYVVTGGFAINFHGIPRLTADLDLIIGLNPSNLKAAVEIFKKLGYEPRLPVPAENILDPIKRKEWRETKNLVAFSFFHPDYQEELVDVIIHKDDRFADYYKDRDIVKILEFEVPIINLNHLKELKRELGRKQDIADLQMIYQLEKIKNEIFDQNEELGEKK